MKYLTLIILFASSSILSGQHLIMWYQEPADAKVIDSKNGWDDDEEWLKALPLGNGSLGAMVFGGVNYERIQLNEESMWSGSPDDNDNPDAFSSQEQIREFLFEGKYKEASELTRKTQICKGVGSNRGNGSTAPFGSFQTLGDLYIDFESDESYSNYYRELDLEEAVVRVEYDQGSVHYKREIFISHPDQVMAVKMTADKPGSLSFNCSLTRIEHSLSRTEKDELIMEGALDNGKGEDGLKYITRLSATSVNGSVKFEGDKLIVQDADEVILYLSASTDYQLEYPSYNGRDYEGLSKKAIKQAKQKPYEQLINDHISDYDKFFSRVQFNISSGVKDGIPTNERVNRFAETLSDPKLIELIFQYGRYLLISSSRPGTLPANLQGIWTNDIQSPWNGDYHTDVNVQMNYWPAEVTNLSEMHLPLFDLTSALVEPGKRTAEIHYHAKGWVVHPITNVWGYTSPGEATSWGMHTGAGAWLTTHVMEHYRFTQDSNFVENIYPVLKGSVEYYMDWLVQDPKTRKWVSGPAVSPENTFITSDGSKYQISMGPKHDQQVIWQLFEDFHLASKVVGKSDEFIDKVRSVQLNLADNEIGSDGRLMEWAEEFEEAEPGHRHISHLFAVHPGNQISLHSTPELASAALKSMDFRIANGGGHTGWSAAWLINQYARLGQGEKAKESLNTVVKKSMSYNLFGQHPPFQMDANFGTTSGIAEMLLQSHEEYISLLPALPKVWKDGEINGLCARGGFVIDMKWKEGKVSDLLVHSKDGGICKLRVNDQLINLETKKNSSNEVKL